ncbi:MAG TPA: DciA family protein [Tepidisphaeraceae bacterium]|jgi:hypothetical protein
MKHTPDNLAQLQKHKRSNSTVGVALGPEMVAFFKQTVEKRQTKLAKIAEVWGQLVPEMFCDHCSLDSLARGSLTVSVDSAPHLYELRQLLLSGLQEQILLACKSAGLRKIVLRAGMGNS